jgi:hypothetical protein
VRLKLRAEVPGQAERKAKRRLNRLVLIAYEVVEVGAPSQAVA